MKSLIFIIIGFCCLFYFSDFLSPYILFYWLAPIVVITFFGALCIWVILKIKHNNESNVGSVGAGGYCDSNIGSGDSGC